ncbi:MAG TPA: F0F1 ATP synthase subunit A [Rickettsiales bacterium]|nr:F0F1 ATP synthase subunit A [Rickettsiales bacterium]
MTEEVINPIEQFSVREMYHLPHVAGYNIAFTNASLFMGIAVLLVCLFMGLGTRKRELVPGRFQSMVEVFYQFVYDMVRESAGPEGARYFPIIFALFIFILFCNLLGMVPYSFTVTSHIIVTFAFAAFVFIGVTCIGFYKHGLHFLHFFLPKGLPGGIGGLFLGFFMVVIEFFSYMARPVSLSIRLAANMTAGHTLTQIMASFVGIGLLGVFPFAFLVLFAGFEVFVACLQAYIFAMLCSIYLNDSLNLHH